MGIQKVKKFNMPYLLCYIFVPVAIIILFGWVGTTFFPDRGPMTSVLLTGPTLLSIFWWVFGGKLFFHSKSKALERELDAKGFARNQTFNSAGATVIVDTKNGQIALIFFWNPFEKFIFPASRISKAWVDDGRHGVGFMTGSSRVSFLFIVDGVKVRVNTFTSNKRWRMDSDYILTGISKADLMVEALRSAGAQTK